MTCFKWHYDGCYLNKESHTTHANREMKTNQENEVGPKYMGRGKRWRGREGADRKGGEKEGRRDGRKEWVGGRGGGRGRGREGKGGEEGGRRKGRYDLKYYYSNALQVQLDSLHLVCASDDDITIAPAVALVRPVLLTLATTLLLQAGCHDNHL